MQTGNNNIQTCTAWPALSVRSKQKPPHLPSPVFPTITLAPTLHTRSTCAQPAATFNCPTTVPTNPTTQLNSPLSLTPPAPPGHLDVVVCEAVPHGRLDAAPAEEAAGHEADALGSGLRRWQGSRVGGRRGSTSAAAQCHWQHQVAAGRKMHSSYCDGSVVQVSRCATCTLTGVMTRSGGCLPRQPQHGVPSGSSQGEGAGPRPTCVQAHATHPQCHVHQVTCNAQASGTPWHRLGLVHAGPPSIPSPSHTHSHPPLLP